MTASWMTLQACKRGVNPGASFPAAGASDIDHEQARFPPLEAPEGCGFDTWLPHPERHFKATFYRLVVVVGMGDIMTVSRVCFQFADHLPAMIDIIA